MLSSSPPESFKLRKPPWIIVQHLVQTNLNATEGWRTWKHFTHKISNSARPHAGFQLPRQQWESLNRLRTGHGTCGHILMYRWKLKDSPECNCGNDSSYQTAFRGGIKGII